MLTLYGLEVVVIALLDGLVILAGHQQWNNYKCELCRKMIIRSVDVLKGYFYFGTFGLEGPWQHRPLLIALEDYLVDLPLYLLP